jgi:hypothetical protein
MWVVKQMFLLAKTLDLDMSLYSLRRSCQIQFAGRIHLGEQWLS